LTDNILKMLTTSNERKLYRYAAESQFLVQDPNTIQAQNISGPLPSESDENFLFADEWVNLQGNLDHHRKKLLMNVIQPPQRERERKKTDEET